MITAGTDLQVLVATRSVDFRKQVDGLAAIVQVALGADPFICGGTDYVAAGPLGPLRSTKSAGSPPHNI